MSDYRFDLPTDAMRRRVARGAMVSGLAQAFKLLVQIISVVLLSRLLPPAEFGIAAMAAPVLALAVLFQDFGLNQATVQKAALTHVEASALFWISALLGLVLGALLMLASPAVALFYRSPAPGQLTAAMAANVVVAGLGAQHVALLNRSMRFTALALLDTLAALLGLLVALGVALRYPSFWAIYFGALATTAVPAVGAWLLVKWAPSRPRRTAGLRALVSFGVGVTGFNFANLFARNLDKVLIGRAWGESPLGLYERAYRLMLFPLQQVNAPLQRVVLPALASLRDDPIRYRHAFLSALGPILLIALPGIAFLTATADLVIPVLLGDRWSESAAIFAALGVAGLVQPLNYAASWLFITQGRTWAYMRWGVFNAVTCAVAFLLGLPYGPLGVAIAYAASEMLRTPVLWAYATHEGPVRLRDVVRIAGPHLAGAFAALAGLRLVMPLLGRSDIAFLGAALLLCYAVALAVALLFPSGKQTVRGLLRLMHQRAPGTE